MCTCYGRITKDHPGVKKWSKMIFSKLVPDRPFGMLKQMVLAHFEPVVTSFGPFKDLKQPKNGPL